MFNRCLAASIIVHTLIIAGVGLYLPGAPLITQKPAYFELTDNSPTDHDLPGTVRIHGAGLQGGHRAVVKRLKSKNHGLLPQTDTIRTQGVKPKETVNPEEPTAASTDVSESKIQNETAAAANDNGETQSQVNEGPAVSEPASLGDGPGSGPGIGGNAPGEGSQWDALIIPPRKIHFPKPDYPLPARRRNWEGTVILRAVITINGRIGKLEVIQSSGYQLLDEAAFKTVKNRWRYRPATLLGRPVEYRLRIPITFRLEDSHANT